MAGKVNYLFSRPVLQQTLLWSWRVSNTRLMLLMFLGSALVLDDKFFQTMVVATPLMIGSQGVGASIRQDCMELLLSRPIRRYQFVGSKWLALLSITLVCCIVHAMSLMIAGESLSKIASLSLSLICCGAISSAAGAMTRMIIIDPRRQSLTLIISLVFVFFWGGADINPAFPWIAVFRKILFPASVEFAQTAAGVFHGVLFSALNVFVLLAVACLILYRQEFSYSLD